MKLEPYVVSLICNEIRLNTFYSLMAVDKDDFCLSAKDNSSCDWHFILHLGLFLNIAVDNYMKHREELI